MARIPIPLYNERQTVASGPELSANAQGGRLGDYAGQADTGLGQGLSEVASVADRYAESQAQAWSTNAASKFKVNQYQNLETAKDNAAPGGDGLTKDYLDGYDKDAQALLDTAPTARSKKYLAVHLDLFRSRMGMQAVGEEHALNKSYLVSSTQDAVDSSAQLIGAPGGDISHYGSELETQLASIKDLSLPPDVKDKLADHTKKTLTDAYWTAYIRDDPQGAAGLLRGRQPLSTPGTLSPQDAIRGEAKAQGVDPRAALAVASIENDTFDPSRGNEAGSSAHGLFQVIGSTWNSLGGTDADRGDMATQAKLGVKNLAQNTRALKDTLRREPTPGEIYSTQWGLGFAGALANAPDNKPVRDIFSSVKIAPDAAMSQNRLPDSMTAGQLRGAFNQQMAKAMNRTAAYANAPEPGQEPAAPLDDNARKAIENTPIPQQLAYLTHAESMARRDDSEKKAAMEGRIADTAAAYSDFKDAPNPPSLPELVDTFGAVHGAQQYGRLQDLQGAAHTGASMATMPDAQINATLTNNQPSPGPGFADRLAVYQKLKDVAGRIQAARKDDYVGYGETLGGGVTKKIDWSQPDAFSGPLAARFIQSGQLAKEYNLPFAAFDKNDVNQLGQALDKAPTQQVGSILQQINGAADTPQHAQMAIAQLAPNHPALAVAGSLPPIGYAGVDNPAQYVIKGERLLRPDKSDKAETGPAKVLLPPDTTGGFRDLWDKSVGGAFAGDKSSDQYYNAAVAYYVGKQDPAKRSNKVQDIDSTLWNEAVNVVAPSVDWNNGKVLVPQGVYPTQFRDTMAKVWPQALQAYGLDPAEHNMDSYPLKVTPDGKYAVTNGTTALWGANGYPVVFGLDGSLPDMKPAPQFEPAPNTKLGKVKDPFSTPMRRGSR